MIRFWFYPEERKYTVEEFVQEILRRMESKDLEITRYGFYIGGINIYIADKKIAGIGFEIDLRKKTLLLLSDISTTGWGLNVEIELPDDLVRALEEKIRELEKKSRR